MTAIQPIFLFSISRTGSTLVQRVIAAHEGVATVSEPWLLLPYLSAFRREGAIADYVQPLLATALEDFCDQLPEGRATYDRELREHLLRLYREAAGADARWFVDKSPYYFVVREVMRLFPDGKFVFLWRNPLSVVASILDTWDHVDWHPTMFRSDLFIGLPRLVAAYREAGDRAHGARFEELVSGDERPWRELLASLGIEFDPGALTRFADVRLEGRMGDPTGVKRYAALSTAPREKWKRTLANPLRKAWCRRYLGFLGHERLAAMGYDAEQMLRELDAQPFSADGLLGDAGRLLADVAKEPLRVRLRRQGLGGPNPIRELLRP
jgi:Sulfotransferase family